ncbi:MAG TPA: hypothetical protein VIL24_02425 [Clostridia bacterium]
MKKAINIIIMFLILGTVLYAVLSCNFRYIKLKRDDVVTLEYQNYQISDSKVINAAVKELKSLNFNKNRRWNPRTWGYDFPTDYVTVRLLLKNGKTVTVFYASDNTTWIITDDKNILRNATPMRYAKGGEKFINAIEKSIENTIIGGSGQ